MYFNGSSADQSAHQYQVVNSVRLLGIALLVMLFITAETGNLLAVTFLRKDNDGTRYYRCSNSCGKIKVVRTATEVYRIFSIPFSGEVKARSFQEAAEQACQADEKPLDKAVSPPPSKTPPSC